MRKPSHPRPVRRGVGRTFRVRPSSLRASGAALALSLAIALSGARPALALNPSADRGRAFVRSHCATCHAVERTGASPWPQAPAFRDLHRRYPVEDLAESFAEGIRTGHPSMPEWKLDPGEINDMIEYLHTLEN
jgi:cytochrome c